MATVTVPADFFRQELRVYGNWREAFARELLQNATDAKPTSIDVRFETVGDHGRVTFTDDGHGMSRDVLDNVFFALGKTTKTGPESIGGFGRARIIICFAQHRYTIRTGTLLVEGEGGTYTITDTGEPFRGTRFVIDLIDEDVHQVRDAFDGLLRQCSLTVPVTVDGVVHPPRQMPSRAARVMKDDAGSRWGRVYVDQGGYYGRLLVRVHGLPMFSRWINGDDTVILELDPNRSRDVLSASRDQLRGEFGTALDQFLSDLSNNRRRALKPPAEPLDVHVGGGGFLATDPSAPDEPVNRDRASVTDAPAPVEARDAENQPGATMDGSPDTPQRGVAVRPANMAAFTNMAAAREAAQGQLDFGLFDIPEPAVPSLGFDVYLMADATDARVRRLVRAWNPTGWDANTGRRRRAVLLGWKAAVGYAIELLVATHPEVGRVLWTVGWTFDKDVHAVHRSVGEGHVLAVNPVDGDGRSLFHLSRRADRQTLLARALHEATHIAVSDHDEQFAGVLTGLFAQVDPAEADRRIRDAAARA